MFAACIAILLRVKYKTMQRNHIIFEKKGRNNEAFTKMYKYHYGAIQRFVTRNSGTNMDAEDLFQDTLIVLVAKLETDEFQLTASPRTYVTAIAKNLWLKKLRNPYHKFDWIDDLTDNLMDEINQEIEVEKTYWDKLQIYMSKISSHCNRLLQEIYFHNKSIDRIQQEYGYSSKHNVINQKYKCIEQIRKVKQQAEKSSIL